MRIGFLGLGSMGEPIARQLLKWGHELSVYNRTKNRARELARGGARVCESPAEAAAGVELLFTMLADDNAVEATLTGASDAHTAGPDALEMLPRDAVHVSLSTISLKLCHRLAHLHESAGQGFVAAPVFGRPDAAQKAKLFVVAAGHDEAMARAKPVLEVIGQKLFVVGTDPWSATIVKLAGNFMLASAIEAMGEAFALIRKAGVAPRVFQEIATQTLFRGPAYEAYGQLIVDEKYTPAGFSLPLGLKDMRLVLEAAESSTVPMPLASLVRDHLIEALARGEADRDWASLAQVSADKAGLPRRGNTD